MKDHSITQRHSSSIFFLILIFTVNFFIMTVAYMLAPLLTDIAKTFDTSTGVSGQLTGAMAFTWALTAFIAGPISDIYGRRLMVLGGLTLVVTTTLGSALAANYASLMALRLLAGVGAAMVPPNCFAALLENFPPAKRGRAMGWALSAIGVSSAIGIPLVALLAEVVNWRFPFIVMGGLLLILWGFVWRWFPHDIATEKSDAISNFMEHMRRVLAIPAFRHLLTANSLQLMAYTGLSGYLAAFLIHVYHLNIGETALPLTLVGAGSIIGSILGGYVVRQPWRLRVILLALLGGAGTACLVFTSFFSYWIVVLLAFVCTMLLCLPWPSTAVLLTDLAGGSLSTTTGLFAVSNQLGMLCGISIGGAMLSFGGFSLIGILCGFAAIAAASIFLFIE